MGITASSATLDDDNFRAIADLAYQECGLKLTSEKAPMVQSRLRHRLRKLGLDDFSTYRSLVLSADGADERRLMISALTTNVSSFFREKHHFDVIREQINLAAKNARRIRIWSAGCSNGQEPYSIAIQVLKTVPGVENLDFKILATDIDPQVVAFAKAGVYGAHMVDGVSASDLETFFVKQGDDSYQIGDKVRQAVTFRELNLLSAWPMQGPFDLILCRNVVIYFDAETQEKLWPRFHALLKPGGHLILGHSERIAEPAMHDFAAVATTTYAKGI